MHILAGFIILSTFYLIGTLICVFFKLTIPPAILGLVFLLFFLFAKGQMPSSLAETTSKVLPLLPLFLIPASARIIEFGPQIKEDGLVLMVAMGFSIALSIALVPFIFLFFIRLFNKQ